MVGYICPRCRRKNPSGKMCPCRMRLYVKDKDKYDFYHSPEWIKLVQIIRARDGGIDRYAWVVHRAYVTGRTVHHIIPIEEDWDKRFDPDNLILVSDSSHGEIHAALKAGGKQRAQVIADCRRAISDQGGTS